VNFVYSDRGRIAASDGWGAFSSRDEDGLRYVRETYGGCGGDGNGDEDELATRRPRHLFLTFLTFARSPLVSRRKRT
jgi:hypothetical protein